MCSEHGRLSLLSIPAEVHAVEYGQLKAIFESAEAGDRFKEFVKTKESYIYKLHVQQLQRSE
jgi:hypothetical protein